MNSIYFNLGDLIKSSTAVSGGLASIYFVPIEDVASLAAPTPDTGKIAKVELKAGKQFYAAVPIINRRSFDEQPQQGDGGTYFTMTVEGFFPFDDEAMHVPFNSMKHSQFLVFVELHSGNVKVIGNLERGADFQHGFNTEDGYTNIPGTTIRFTWESPHNAPLFDPSGTVGPNGTGDAGGGGPAF